MLRVALTGGIATGKSHVLAVCRRRGVPCLDADELAHGVMAAGTEASAAIGAAFGRDVLAADGAVDRRRLGPIVFADAEARRRLEAIVHPAVYRAITAGLRAFELTGIAPLAVVDVPLLFESGHEREFDAVVATLCTPERQYERLRARGLSDDDIANRLEAQWPAARKAARADFVISTDGTYEETDAAVDGALAALRERAGRTGSA
jgi:dephospho-CoA kinase